MQYSQTASGQFPTSKASAYLQQLCKHFAHKIPVSFDDVSGQVEFPTGSCVLAASESGLHIQLSASTPEDLTKAKSIIDSHLERFAFREGFKTMAWT